MKIFIRLLVDLPLLCMVAAGAVVGVLGGGWLLAVCGVTASLLRLLTGFVLSRSSERPRPKKRQNKKAISKTQLSAKSAADKPHRSTPPKESTSLVEQMLDQGRFALLLRPKVADNLSAAEISAARDVLDRSMALSPEGDVVMLTRSDDDAPPGGRQVRVEAMFLDRHAVTNRQFQNFVESGGYEQMSLWDPEVWPAVVEFTDQSGRPGPRYWEDGSFPASLADHPVVGVCWYEASAYARWVGKRLPTDPEWVKAGCWPVSTGNGPPTQRRFPWGEAMDRDLANLWGPGRNATVPVDQYEEGESVTGARQLIGNVWEWTASGFGVWDGGKIETAAGMKSLRGGAFDTYFDSQATCHFQSGDSPLARKHNIGFRCGIGVCDLAVDCLADIEPAADESVAELI